MTMRRALSIYMFAESKTLRMGIRYDIGNDLGWGGMLNLQSNPFGEIAVGFIEARAAQRKDLQGEFNKNRKTHARPMVNMARFSCWI